MRRKSGNSGCLDYHFRVVYRSAKEKFVGSYVENYSGNFSALLVNALYEYIKKHPDEFSDIEIIQKPIVTEKVGNSRAVNTTTKSTAKTTKERTEENTVKANNVKPLISKTEASDDITITAQSAYNDLSSDFNDAFSTTENATTSGVSEDDIFSFVDGLDAF